MDIWDTLEKYLREEWNFKYSEEESKDFVAKLKRQFNGDESEARVFLDQLVKIEKLKSKDQ
jgi:hypothetical protein